MKCSGAFSFESMAVTSIWDVRGRISSVIKYASNESKTWNADFDEAAKLHAIGNTVEYSADEMKTEKQLYVSGVNCSSKPDEATRQFFDTQKIWKREKRKNDIVCFHGYQSFKTGETTPEVAHKIGVELAKRLWGDRFEVLVSTHLNTKTVHNHFVLNAVSFVDGKRYHDQKATYKRMRQISDEICKEYGLSVVSSPQGGGMKQWEIAAEQSGADTVREQMRRDIDIAVRDNVSFRDFWRFFECLGYTLEYRGKYLRARPDGRERFFRLDKLGEGFTEQNIKDRFKENFDKARSRVFHSYPPSPHENPTGLRDTFIRYGFLLGDLPRNVPQSREVYAAMKEDRLKNKKYMDAIKLMGKYGIETADDLKAFTEKISDEFLSLSSERTKLRNSLRRMNDTEKMTPIRERISEISAKIAELRRQMKICTEIAERSGAVEQIVNKIYENGNDKTKSEVKKQK